MPPYNLRRSPEKSRKAKEAEDKPIDATTGTSSNSAGKTSTSWISSASDQLLKAPNYGTLQMLGQIQPSREPRARDFAGFRDITPSQDVDDTVQGVDDTTVADEDDTSITLFQARNSSSVTEESQATSADASRMDMDKTDFTMGDAETSTPKRTVHSSATDDAVADDDGTTYPDVEDLQTILLGQLTLSDTQCVLHCRDDEIARLHEAAPDAVLQRRDDLLDDLERLYRKQLFKTASDNSPMLLPRQIATDLVCSIESMKYFDLEFRGLDPDLVESRLKWAKWVATAAAAGLFHSPNQQCGSFREQFDAVDSLLVSVSTSVELSHAWGHTFCSPLRFVLWLYMSLLCKLLKAISSINSANHRQKRHQHTLHTLPGSQLFTKAIITMKPYSLRVDPKRTQKQKEADQNQKSIPSTAQKAAQEQGKASIHSIRVAAETNTLTALAPPQSSHNEAAKQGLDVHTGDTQCENHCREEEVARLRSTVPNSNLAHRNRMLEGLERFYDIETAKAIKNDQNIPSIDQISTYLAGYLEEVQTLDIEYRGFDPNFVRANVEWAKWIANSAASGLFHRPDERYGSFQKQVQRAFGE
ncbi:hypothetical protein BU16DRAFT_566270 [Lophium mytilinum]|uniref:Uncharacterized protein n=1 Tax=Lophium mytilinum TaxID=390894 RepID=A0A6A6QE03_9PEZI|nr:hypothetical protein BU16DRAFT_566270 [Lophium mytilinum]